MTLLLWQKKPKLIYSKNVVDIVQFGSSMSIGRVANDIDIAVIFQKIPLKEQLQELQQIKKQLQEQSEKPIHAVAFDLYSYFDAGNFTKENILAHGRSIISGEYFSKMFGMVPKVQISYILKGMEKKDKVRY